MPFDNAEWKARREILYNMVLDLIPERAIRNKHILEVGCRYGHLGAMFFHLTPNIVGFDVRLKSIEIAKKLHPMLKFFVWDIDITWPNIQKFDIILHLGTLYHLANPQKNLAELCSLLREKQCAILETEYVNSIAADKVVGVQQEGDNVSYKRIGHRPSYAMIEETLRTHRLPFKRITTDKYNSRYSTYDALYDYDDSLHKRKIRGIWYFQR